MTEELIQKPERITWKGGIVIFGTVILLWLLTPVVMTHFVAELPARGQAGDLYGSINALFSGLAFAGIIIAIFLQREELSLQRLELALTRTELAKSATAQEESQKALNKTIHAQSFKVAMDIIENPDTIRARAVVFSKMAGVQDQPVKWSSDMINSAELVARTFETVGTMIRQETLPAAYIIDTWSVPIARSWKILEFFVIRRRTQREDPYIGKDFEFLAGKAQTFLENEQAKAS